MEHRGELSTTKFTYRKRLGTYDAHQCVSHTMLSVLDSVQDARILQIDFIAASNRVKHQTMRYGIL